MRFGAVCCRSEITSNERWNIVITPVYIVAEVAQSANVRSAFIFCLVGFQGSGGVDCEVTCWLGHCFIEWGSAEMFGVSISQKAEGNKTSERRLCSHLLFSAPIFMIFQ